MEPLKNPPITEALIDFQVEFPSPINMDRLDGACGLFTAEYPTKEVRRRFEQTVEVKDGKSKALAPKDSFDAFVLWDKTRQQAIQCRLNGFAFSRLKPYSSGDALIAETQKLWKIYRDHLKPSKVGRIAMKYINNIPVNVATNPKDLLPLLASTPETSPPQIEQYISRIAYKKGDTTIMLTQASSKAIEGIINYVVDIEVFKICALDPTGDDQMIWDIINEFRVIKNDAFEKCTSPLARRPFK